MRTIEKIESMQFHKMPTFAVIRRVRWKQRKEKNKDCQTLSQYNCLCYEIIYADFIVQCCTHTHTHTPLNAFI